MAEATVAKRDPTEIRRRWKTEPEVKRRRSWESSLVNLTRKLSDREMEAVCLHAERLAVARINAQLAADRASATARRIAKREIKRLAAGSLGEQMR